MKERRFFVAGVMVPLLFGILCLVNVLTGASTANYRAVDEVRLIAGGALMGVAFMGMMMNLRGRQG